MIQDALYLSIAVIAIFMEVSPRIPTDSFWQKLGLGMVAIGALARLHSLNILFPAGILLYLSGVSWNCYKAKRRSDD